MNCSHAEEQRAPCLFFFLLSVFFFSFFCCCLPAWKSPPESSHLSQRGKQRRGKGCAKVEQKSCRGKKKRRLHERYSPMRFRSFRLSEKKKKKKISLQTLEKSHFLELKWVKLHPSRGFHLILLFWGLFLGLLPDEISDFLEKLARVMSRSRNDSRSFFFSSFIWKRLKIFQGSANKQPSR